MLHNNNVKIENQIAHNMLQEAVTNQAVKTTLHEAAAVLINRVLKPLQRATAVVDNVLDLPEALQTLISELAAELTAERRQYGALLPETISSKEIMSSMSKVRDFLHLQENFLGNIIDLKRKEDLVVAIKIIVELGCAYFEAPQQFHSTNFTNIKNLIWPTQSENDSRMYRNELGEQPKFALTYGIGTEPEDLGLQSLGEGRLAGKSVFGSVNMRTRLSFLMQSYDATKEEKYKKQMESYAIPLDPKERKSLDEYVKRWETSFEKLCRNTALPMIASVSRATARLLVTLQDLQAFNRNDGSFDFDKAQMFANAIAGFIVEGSHHSLSETAEVYDRLLDVEALKTLEQQEGDGLSAEISKADVGFVEKNMPYYRYGDYGSFFHRSYTDKVVTMDKSIENISHQALKR